MREAQARHKQLFDAPKFRFAGASIRNARLHLKIGLTSYKEYAGYRYSPSLRRMAAAHATRDARPLMDFMPNAMGNVAIVLTRDGRSIAIRRSRRVSSYAGYYDLPGGHPEPDELQSA
jgi:hypothetical protein